MSQSLKLPLPLYTPDTPCSLYPLPHYFLTLLLLCHLEALTSDHSILNIEANLLISF
jgi:hypothetical protein